MNKIELCIKKREPTFILKRQNRQRRKKKEFLFSPWQPLNSEWCCRCWKRSLIPSRDPVNILISRASVLLELPWCLHWFFFYFFWLSYYYFIEIFIYCILWIISRKKLHTSLRLFYARHNLKKAFLIAFTGCVYFYYKRISFNLMTYFSI